nr:hypothetical protein [Tanacetum cinerariifolium]GEY91993.1 hypothetical protein [Tanacetum cinerariifolium]
VSIFRRHLAYAQLCVMGLQSYLLVSKRTHQGRDTLGSETIKHSSEMILLLRNVTIPPTTENFIIPCAVDGIARIFLTPEIPIIPL